jgi:hypothetical protein
MAVVESDDIIAADPCMQEDSKVSYRNGCEARQHYKREMCRMAIRRGSERRSLEQCFRDPLFMGSTVANDGVGE